MSIYSKNIILSQMTIFKFFNFKEDAKEKMEEKTKRT
jgi:hypothetical protein